MIHIHTAGERELVTRQSFDSFITSLKMDSRFYRCNRGVVINLEHAVDFDGSGFRLDNGSNVPVSRKLLKNAGIEEHVRFHDLRHTFATMAISSGVDVKTCPACWATTAQASLLTPTRISPTICSEVRLRRSAASWNRLRQHLPQSLLTHRKKAGAR